MKKVFILVFMLWALATRAQVTAVKLQASGLTCSLCSNAINKSLKKLDFVNTVLPDIKNSSFDITFRPGAQVDFDLLKKKVEDAGFSVSNLTAIVHFDHVTVNNDEHVTIGNIVYHFLRVNNQVISGDKTIRLLDKGYVSTKEYKANGRLTKMECYKTGVAGSCCAKDKLQAGRRIFHVTLV